jgi:two-component system chemotaxis sensor kinase CheA
MDVVMRNVQAMGGRVYVRSEPGASTRISLSLPLTLAVLDGMIVAIGGESYILPTTNIVESRRPEAGDVRTIVGAGQVLALRGEYVRLIYLHETLGIPGALTDPSQGLVVVVENEGQERVGLVVDGLIGQQQVVIKSLEANYRSVEGVSGATILGDGRVALILDVAGLQAMGPSIPGAVIRGAAAPLENRGLQ